MAAQNELFIVDGPWPLGADSLLYTTDVTQGCYAWGVNVINRGGIIQTRTGKRRIVSFCGNKAQGVHWCRTFDDRNYLLVAIDGHVYVAQFPFKMWSKLPGVSFSPDAERIWFCTGEQAVHYTATNTIALLPNPKNVVFMQDGVNLPCYWDAMDLTSGVVNQAYVGPFGFPMRVGTAMLWKDNRLWMAVNNLVYASDLLQPASFQEETYLASQSGFRFPRSVVNMVPSPVQDVLVLTDSSMHTLKSSVQDRTQWGTTQGFQSDVNVEVGLIAPRAIAYLHGMPWIFTARGVISYDRALTTNLTTVLLTIDGEMQRSKTLLSPDVTAACMGYWENVLLVSAPASSLYNRHTWVLDAGIAQKLNLQSPMCWTGIWTGTFPVQFVSPIVGGTQYNYELSYSGGFLALNEGDSPSPMIDPGPEQAYIHLWQNFIPVQIDDVETSISCSVETKAFTLQTDDYYRFCFAEFMIVNLKGVVPVQVFIAGLAGNYHLLFETTLRADIGPWGNPSDDTVLYYVALGQTTIFESYRKQVRHMRTKEWVVKETDDGGSSCTEIQRMDGVDKAFQLMIRWQGQLGLRQLKFFYDRQMQVPVGQCPTDESTVPHIILEATEEVPA